MPDHDPLFANLAAALRPGGTLVAQCGGTGNVATVFAAPASAGRAVAPDHTNFAGPAETTRRLEASGFRDVWVWLQQEPTRFEPGEQIESFLATVVLRTALDGLPPGERRALAHEVAIRLPRPEIDYVRLNILARRA